MSESLNSRMRAALLGCAAVAAVGTFASLAPASAQDNNAVETVVVTGTRFNTDAAPAKARLDTTEPQTIINRNYIANFVPPQSDYVTILAIVPSLTGGDTNGPGLSDGGAKNTLRGFQDGNFNMTYDGIPFGDTNGPTHHNISYFPASTIGSIDVDRGPGNAGNLGSNTYGGTIKMFSEGLTDDMHAKALASYGSFNTALGVANFQSGDVDTGGFGTIRAMVNAQYLHSDGALSLQDLFSNNILLKVQDQLGSHWTITLFANQNFLKENLDDNNGDTPAQVAYYGKDFSLQNTNPALPTYQRYNFTSKHTDMDYVREDGDLFWGMKLDNTTYTYAYWNHTLSPNNQEQTQCDILNDTSEGNYPSSSAAGCAGNKSLVFANGTVDPNNAILGYSKENAYRVYGDILRVSEDYDFGWIDGQVRGGVWWETQATHRFKYYFDSITCGETGTNVFDVGDVAANAACGVAYRPYAGAYTGASMAPAVKNGGQTSFGSAKSIQVGNILGVNELGFAKDDEHSDWTQYQPFLEVDIKALDDRLTITPGVKFIHWDHAVDAPVGQGNLCGIGANDGAKTATNPEGTGGVCPNAPGDNYTAGFITRDTLPFATVNYKIEPTWTVYLEYAKGIYIPDISTFENNPPTGPGHYPSPETTTNYQFGTVYYADQFTFDADVYYIPINNNYVVGTCTFDSSESCYIDNGTAIYKGLEGEGTYAFDQIGGFDLRGLSVFTNGALMSSKGTTAAGVWGWLSNAPMWTAAGGMLYQTSQWKFALIDKLVGPQYDYNVSTSTHIYKQQTYGDLTATAGYTYVVPDIGSVELSANADNLLNSRKTILITVNDATYQPNPMTSTNQFFYQSPRSVFVSLALRY